MAIHYPVKFTLDDNVHVEVNKTADKTYDFTLTPKHGSSRHFTFVEQIPRDKGVESLDFDQLNAVRRFWLEQEEEE